jgi:tetratricopeptide (TPR) repeat protein
MQLETAHQLKKHNFRGKYFSSKSRPFLMKLRPIPKLISNYPSNKNMVMKTKTLLCAALFAIGATATLDFTGAMAEGSPQSNRHLALMQRGSTKNAQAKAYVVSGNAKFERKDYQGAIADYSRAISLDPNYANAYYSRGLAKRLMGDSDSAIEDYKQALKINPDDADTYNSLGNVLIGNNSSEALEYLNRAIQIEPNNANAYANRGMARFNLQDYEGAIADYDRSIALDPNHPGVPRTRRDRDWAIQTMQGRAILDRSNRVRNSGIR